MIEPPVAVHVTPVFDEPVTFAEKVWVLPVCSDAEVGVTLTATAAAVATVTLAVAVFEVSATLVAVTSKVPAVLPAVYIPADEIVPPVALQVTVVFDVPVTVAENCCLASV